MEETMWWNLPHGAKEWCIRFIIFLIYLKIGEEQNMLNNNVTRNKMCTINHQITKKQENIYYRLERKML
jgi:hypothetical protein